MDAFFPFINRPLQPGEPTKRLINPVTKYTRFSPEDAKQFHWIAWPSEQQRQSAKQQQQQPQSADHPLLETSHAATPEADQHVDADGHLDIYV